MSTTTTQTINETSHSQVQLAAPPAAAGSNFQDLARGDRAGRLKLRGIPTFSDPLAQRQWMKEHMAAAFRFFAKHGYAEGIAGHISMRDPILPDHLWLNPYAKHFADMRASDLVLVDHDGYVVEGGNQAVVNTAGFIIHSEVHKARPDVWAAAHAHSVHGKTWSAFGRPVEMLTQDSCNFYGKQSVYDDHGGAALAQEEGQAIAAALGKENMVCILKNHGLLTAGSTVDEAAFLFYSLDKACHSQLLAEAAAANSLAKSIISDEVAQFNADVIQNADNFYIEFQPEFDLIVKESNGEVL
ncbi:class II aldolase/adducin domain protein, partial [Ilyonectria destructans]